MEPLIVSAIAMASIAALSGITAVGSGSHWKFHPRDYLRGKRNAILYLWVITSTIFSIVHAGVLLEAGLDRGFEFVRPTGPKWFAVHTAVGVLFTWAHVMVKLSFARNGKGVLKKDSEYLWGPIP